MLPSNLFHVFLHEHLWEPQSDLQLHLKSLTKTRELLVGSSYRQSLPSTSFQPQSCGGSTTPLYCCIPGGKPWGCCSRQRLHAEVGGRHSGCTNEVPAVISWQKLEYRNESRLSSDRPLSWFALPHSRLPSVVYRTRWLSLRLCYGRLQRFYYSQWWSLFSRQSVSVTFLSCI